MAQGETATDDTEGSLTPGLVGDCTGAHNCAAERHIHGCFAEPTDKMQEVIEGSLTPSERCTCPEDPYLKNETCPVHGGSRGANLPLSKRQAKIVTRVILTSPWPEGVTNMADARLIVSARIKAVLTNATWHAHGLDTEITEVQ